ncbi:hypothetical protein J5Y09_24055 [Roseomonas sp. PWR1]|uniref:Peptidase M41 domain-containing protein n=1 Tax=Roseomonas nitratireducens TaxID=2820810 RepID=A0ABS4B068_9PROT|nr:hypothetical protein [Neoroseomonas nitratireducens]MBP0467018.1 hypothetical protein [Neoroseomonas nitratireducens]
MGAAVGDPAGIILAAHEWGHVLVALRAGATEIAITRVDDGWRVDVSPPPASGVAAMEGMLAGVLGELLHAMGGDADKVVTFVRQFGKAAFSATAYGEADLVLIDRLQDADVARLVAGLAPSLAADLAAIPHDMLEAMGRTLLRQRVGDRLPIVRAKAAA